MPECRAEAVLACCKFVRIEPEHNGRSDSCVQCTPAVQKQTFRRRVLSLCEPPERLGYLVNVRSDRCDRLAVTLYILTESTEDVARLHLISSPHSEPVIQVHVYSRA